MATLRKNEQDNRRRDLFFPQVLRDARRIGEYRPGPVAEQSRVYGPARSRAGPPRVQVHELLRFGRGGARVLPEIEKLLLEFFPDATDALVYNHDVFDKDYAGDRTEDQDNKNPG